MIRLSCWIGGVGHETLPVAEGGGCPERAPSPGPGSTPLKRAIFEDVLVADPLKLARFADRAEALAAHFRRVGAEADSAMSWHRFWSSLGHARGDVSSAGSGQHPDRSERTPCVTD